MKKWTAELLRKEGYEIANCEINSADLTMADHGILDMDLVLEGNGFGVIFGGYVLGHGYVNAKEFKGSEAGLEYIMRVMDTVGVDRFSRLKHRHVRIASKGWGDRVKIIGNIIDDKWFDAESFFKDKHKGDDDGKNS